MDTDRPDGHDDVDAGGVAYADAVAEPVAAPKSRMLLGTLAGLVVVVLGIAAWGALYAALDRDYVGITVVLALLIGYVVREVSRRSDLPPRIVSALLTALLCLVGSISAVAVGLVLLPEYTESYWPTFTRLMERPQDVLKEHNPLTWAIFGAAVVAAFFSAMPPKPKKTKGAPAAAPAATPAAADDERRDDTGALPPTA